MRSMSVVRAATILVALLAFERPAAAQLSTDVKGGADHPAVSRYAGSVMVGHAEPPLPAVHMPLEEVGSRAAEGALASLEHTTTRARSKICLQPWLVERPATGPASQANGPHS